MIFAKEPYLLHLLAGSETVTALDAAKSLLDAGFHDANEREPADNISPLHMAAAWNNLAMCQLLIHYGADVNAKDIDKRRPEDVANGESRRFLRRLRKKRRHERNKFRRILTYLFRGICTHPDAVNQSMLYGPEELKNSQHRKTCPPTVQTTLQPNRLREIAFTRVEPPPNLLTPTPAPTAVISVQPPSILPTPLPSIYPAIPSAPTQVEKTQITTPAGPNPDPFVTIRRKPTPKQMPKANVPTPRRERPPQVWHTPPQTPTRISSRLIPSAPARQQMSPTPEPVPKPIPIASTPPAKRRSSSLMRDEFLTSDNTGEDDIQLEIATNSGDEAEHRKQEEAEQALRQQFAQLNLEDLKRRLKRKNCRPVGPMDARNRRVYEAKLAKMEAADGEGCDGKNNKKKAFDSISGYSPALQKMVLNQERGGGQIEVNKKIGQREEVQIRNEYLQSTPNNEVSFFCYLLVDPTRLPADLAAVTFRLFLASIFYVGKGKRSRPLQHLIHASKCRAFAKTNPIQRSDKLKHILDLWDQGRGVISLHVFNNVHSAEALVREGAMIDAIGLDNLTNIQRGSFPGAAAKWSRQQITEFGALLLHRAHVIFQNERCRPIFEEDVAGLSWQQL